MEETLKDINNNIIKLSDDIHKLRLGDYVELLNSPVKIFYSNFMWGLARGLGMAVGFTILGALVLYFLNSIVWDKIPIIGSFIAEIVKIVQHKL